MKIICFIPKTLILFLSFFILRGAQAQESQKNESVSSSVDVELVAAPEDPQHAVDEETLRELYERAHEAFESGEKPASAQSALDTPEHVVSLGEVFSKKAWVEKFSFKQILLNALRWYQIEATNEQIKEHVANVILMLSMSHFSEGIIGYQLASLGLKVDNVVVNTLGLVMGVSIVIPGLDPLCILLGWTYKKIPHLMSKIMYVPRVVILTGAEFLYRKLGFNALYENLFLKQEAVARLRALMENPDPSRELLRMDENLNFVVRHKGQTLFRLEGKIAGEKILWNRMHLTEELRDPMLQEYLKKKISVFNWVLRHSILDVVARLEDPQKIARLTYIENAVQQKGGIEVEIKNMGMASPSRKHFIGFRNCLSLLRL